MVADLKETVFWPSKWRTKFLIFVLGLGLALLTYLFLPASCPEPARRAAAIVTASAVFWVFELFPLYATSLLIIIVLTFSLAVPEGLLPHANYTLFLTPFADPVIILFFGGFVLAAAISKYRLDNYIAHKILSYFGQRPYSLLIGIMITTAFIGLWFSNTATAVIMLAIIQPFLREEQIEPSFKKCIALAIPFAASISGTGTPIASPPNAIVMGLLEQKGIDISFFKWMLICVPLVAIRIFMASLVLRYLFPTHSKRVETQSIKASPLDRNGTWIAAISLSVIVLFVTSSWTGIPEAVVALMGAAILTTTGFLNREDLKRIDWDILILMWGGLALGLAVDQTGLGKWMINLPIFAYTGVLLVIIFSMVAFLCSTVMSNTTTAALILPLALSIPGENTVMLAITVTLASSMGLMFPISSPPNALAYGTGAFSSRDMFISGLTVDLLSLLLIFGGFWFVIPAVLG
jgi:sodium-dependent dicarboxylate transporter 2/3/5